MKSTLKSISIVFIIATFIAACTTKSDKAIHGNILPVDTTKIGADTDSIAAERDSVAVSK